MRNRRAAAVKRKPLYLFAAAVEIIMDIILVTSSFNDEVHGTDDEKKTGCGVVLTKPENASRFSKGGKMTDLKEITCEKCKEKLAKKIIKADKKEMAKLLKEERARAKKGIEDEGIIPLGNTTAKITKTEEQKRQEEEERLAIAKREAEEAARAAEEAAAKAAAEEAERKRAAKEAERAEREALEAAEKMKANDKVALDDDLAEFAIDVPEETESETDLQDDFLAQFAIQKPEEDVDSSKEPLIQDDFLAQFAIPVPKQDDELEEIEESEEMDDISFENVTAQPAVEEIHSEEVENNPEIVIESEDDIMKMFSIDPASEQTDVSASSEPVSRYENDLSVIDIVEHELSAVEPEPEIEPEEPEQLDLSGISEWDDVVNRIFGVQTSESEEISDEMEEISLPKIDDTPAADSEAAEPVIEEIAVSEPEEIAESVIEELAISEPEEVSEPMIEEIAVPEPEEIAEPVIEEIAVPELEEVSEPMIEELAIPEPEEVAEPMIGEIAVPELEEVSEPMIEEITVPEPEEVAEPVIEEIEVPKPVENIQIPQTAPINTVPVQPVPVAPASAPAPVVQPAAPVQNSVQPQIISVPQFAGYDMNGQPVYTYVQMQMTGSDANSQPIFVPINGQQPIMSAPQTNPAAPVQPSVPVQPAALVQPSPAPVPVAPAPVKQPAFGAANDGTYVQPTANISKIAVNPHAKSTSQAFVNAIASSKDYANKNLIETQGLRANSPILTSVEDVLSQMGDDSLAKKKAAEQKNVVPVNEYKGPVKSAPKTSAPVQKTEPAKDDIRFMSKADLKAKKKQDKIDAKFKKDMAKRGF
ncbi:MAG: hypothetical protein NC485_09025 [Ruminococcus flavefaciens]|nr:hypothetical protein [Ruminococcus flavefaciens]MCM1060129.1 hypothetical protein [Eubacterium sp.]